MFSPLSLQFIEIMKEILENMGIISEKFAEY